MPGFELIDHEERKAVNDIFELSNGVLFAHGFENIRNKIYKVRDFEESIRKKFNTKYSLAVSSCTAALRVALASLNLKSDDEVIIPSFTFVATAEAVIESGAKLIISDINETLNMDPISLENSITNNTKAIIPVHMMGVPAELDEIMLISRKYNLKVIEDAAWGVGVYYNKKPLGTIGDLGCYSFDAGKCISTGEGGMIVTNNEKLFLKCRAFHDHGHEYSSQHSRGEDGAIGVGFNFRMTELQAAIGIVQLGKLDKIHTIQRQNKNKLKKLLIDGGYKYSFRKETGDLESTDSLILKLPDKNISKNYVNELKKNGIGTKNIPDAIKWHFAPYWSHIYEKYGYYKNSYKSEWKKSELILSSSLALPIMFYMDDDKILKIAETILNIK